jgi:hypothetical protein
MLNNAIHELGLRMQVVFTPYSECGDAVPSPSVEDLSFNWHVVVRGVGDCIYHGSYREAVIKHPAAARYYEPRLAELREACERGVAPPCIADVLTDFIQRPSFCGMLPPDIYTQLYVALRGHYE